jgi:glc operon protein GlcG
MRANFLTGFAVGAVFALGGAHAQQAASPGGSAPQPPDYGAPITVDQAKGAAAAAIAEAAKNGWHMAVAIVDPGGYLVYFERMDGTQNASVRLAQSKARTAALFRYSSKVFFDQFTAGNTGFMSFPDDVRPIASEGGLPIILDGKLIGAIGASGGTGQQDGVAAMAGANAAR